MTKIKKGCTESCEAGPFFTENFPTYPSGSSISKAGTVGEPMHFTATVRDIRNHAIPNVVVEVVIVFITCHVGRF